MSGTIPPASSRQPKRATSACEACRALKVKCLQPEEGEPCTKCARSNTQCVFPEPRQKARVSQRAKPRLVDLESKLTNIIGLLSRPHQSSAPHGGVQTSVETSSEWPTIFDAFNSIPNTTAELAGQGCPAISQVNERPEWTTHQDDSDKNVPEEPVDVSTAMDTAWIIDLGISPVVLDYLLDTFRGMAPYFPFVTLPGTCTAASMAEERPFLLLAIAAAASSKFCHLQDALIKQFKESLSKRVVMAGEKDLDLLQGLLVHLAWFQFHFIPGSQQDYLYLQIAISMVIDLHLDKEAAYLVGERSELSSTYTREACRAYLGCFYMSSIITMSSGRPNKLQYHKNMLPCALTMQQHPEFETDLLIYPVTKVLHFAEEANEIYSSEDFHGPSLCIHARQFTTRLEDWWSSLSLHLSGTVFLRNAYHIVKIRIQEMGLVYCYGQRQAPFPKAQGDSTLLPLPSMVINNLIKCVSSTKESLDSFLAIPITAHGSLPFATWFQLILTLFVLYRLSVGLPEVPDWDTEIAQQTVDLQAYFDTLLSYLQDMKPSPDRQIPTKSLFSRLPEVMESVRTSYAVAKDNTTEVQDSLNAHNELKALENNTVPSIKRLHRCPALRYSGRKVVEVPSQAALRSAIAREIQLIEDERLWNDLFFVDTPSMV